MKVIPIVDAITDSHEACREDDGTVPQMKHLSLTRREFLEGSGILTGVLALGTPVALLAPSRVWALELKNLSTAEGEALMAMGRVLFPHSQLPDSVYALLARDLDNAASDASKRKTLQEGITKLNQSTGETFAKASENKRTTTVKMIEKTPFFAMVRGQCVTSLYDNDMAYATFGYPGSAWEKGGYITRGFQDLKWLPDPPADASPTPWMG